MRRSRLSVALSAIVVGFALVLVAAQSWGMEEVTLNLARTGQTVCTDTGGAVVPCAGTGQDGATQSGVAWPVPRFRDNGDLTVTDLLTGLTWTKNAESPGNNQYLCSATNITVNWQQALDHVTCLNSHKYLGFEDWRLPNINEIESLVNSDVADSTPWLNSQGFVNVWGQYWSSTTAAGPGIDEGLYAQGVNFLTGETGITAKTATSYLPAIWPVRGTSHGSAPLAKTGQTKSYAKYDDGHYQAGIAWPPGRFQVQGECVTDRLTGLVWPQNADRMNGLQSWTQALDYASTLNLCGHDDWRLPNRKELLSLVSRGQADPAAWLMSQGFANVRYQPTPVLTGPYFPYWSSTSYVYNPVAAFGVRMDMGYIGAFMKAAQFGQNGYVWPVRSGASGGIGLPTDTPRPTPTLPPTPTPTATPTPIPKPTVASVAPAQGKAGVAGFLQVEGGNFEPGAVARLGYSQMLSTTYGSPTELIAALPALAPDVYDLTVINPDGYSGILGQAYTAQGPAQDDLYSHNYELTSGRQHAFVGEMTVMFFVVHRLGGDKALKNVRVDFYLGDPRHGGQKLGQAFIADLKPNQFQGCSIFWTPSSPGVFEIYAVIDPANEVAEGKEDNNLYQSWVDVQQKMPADTVAPVVHNVATGLSRYTTNVPVTIDASDSAPSSGLAWSYFLTWEFMPMINDWLVMEESGWQPYSYYGGVSIFDWPGPRILEVYVADNAQNVSDPSGLALFNYIPPDDFLLTGESRWYLYPVRAGEKLKVDMTLSWPDADLYVWDEQGNRVAYSVQDGATAEHVNFTASRDGLYWLEIYAYGDYPSFFVSAAVLSAADAAEDADVQPSAVGHTSRTTPGITLSEAPLAPSRSYRLPPIEAHVYVPLLRR